MNDGLGAALTIPKGVLSDIAEAQKKIEAMQKDSIDLAKNFTQFAKDANTIKSSLDNVKVTLDTSQAEQKIQNLLNMINSLNNQPLPIGGGNQGGNSGGSSGGNKGGGGSGSAGSQNVVDYEEKLNKIMEKRATTFAQVRERLREIEKLNDQIAKNSPGSSVQHLARQFTDLLNALDGVLSFDQNRLDKLLKNINNIDTSSIEGAKLALRSYQAAREELMKDPIANAEGIKNTTKEIENLRVKIKELDRDKPLSNFDKELNKINNLFGSCSQGAAALGQMMTSVFGDLSIAGFFRQLVNVRGEFEMAEKSLSVILRDSVKAADIFNEIQQISIESPYATADLVGQTKKLAAFRIETDKLVDTTKMLGDIAAGTGVDIDRLILAYGQVRSAEFLKGTELRQFSEAGVNLLGGLSERFTELYGRAVSVGEVMQMISKRMVKFSDVEAVLQDATALGGTFYNMQKQQAETLQGMVVNLKDRVAIEFNEIGETYEDLIKGIVKGAANLVSSFSAVSNLLLPIFSGKLIGGIGRGAYNGFLALIKGGVGEAAKDAKTLAEAFAKMPAGASKVKTALNGVKAAAGGIPGIIAAAVMFLGNLYMKATELKREVRSIAKEAKSGMDGSVAQYTKLAQTAADTSRSEKERIAALDTLKRDYGNILDLQSINLKNSSLLIENEYGYIEAIKERYQTEARLKAEQEAKEHLSNTAQSRKVNRVMEYANSFDKILGLDLSTLFGKDYKQTITDTIKKVEAAILSEDIDLSTITDYDEKLKAASKVFYTELLDELELEVPEEQMNNFLDAISEKRKNSPFTWAINALEDITEVFSGQDFDTGLSKVARLYKAKIDELSNIEEDFTKQLTDDQKAAFEKNPAAQKRELEKAIKKKAAEIKEIIDTGALGSIKTATKDQLNQMLSDAVRDLSLDPVEKAIVDAQDKVYKKFAKDKPLRYSLSTGVLAKADEDDLQDYIKKLTEQRDEWKSAMKGWDTTEAQKAELTALWGDKATMQNMINAMDQYISLLGPVYDTQKQVAKEAAAELKDEISDLKVELDLLWDKFDTAKKFEGWGMKIFGFDSTKIYQDIIKLENKILSLGGDDAENAYRDATARRLKLGREAQEEAAKIIYESQKKALTRVEQAYKKMYEDIATIQKGANAQGTDGLIGGQDIREGISGVFEKTQKELADAQWEAYKESEWYLAAFGDLSNMSSEMLKALKEDLEAFAKTDLNPSDKKAIAGQIEKLNDALVENEKLKGVWDVITYGFKKIKEGYEGLDKLPGLQETALNLKGIADAKKEEAEAARTALKNAFLDESVAQEEYNDAISSAFSSDTEIEEANQRLLEAIDRREKAQKRLDDANAASTLANNAANEAQKKYTDTLESSTAAINNSTEALEGQIEAYTEVGNTISDIFKSTEDIVSAFGGELGDSTEALFDGFSEGYAVIANLLSITMNATKAFKAIKAAVKTASTALSTLTVIGIVIAAVVAAIKIFDTIQAKKIEANAKAVKDLQKAYEGLDKAIEKALKISESEEYFSRMTANLARQKDMIEESIALQQTRKPTDKVREETEQLMEDLDAVSEKLEELRSKRHELLGAPSDYVSEAESWASSWLSSIGEVEGGLESLRKDFDSFIDNLIVAQLRSEVFGDVFDTLKQMTDDILKDGLITSEEAEALKRFRETNLKLVNEQGKAYLEALGVSMSGKQMENTLSKNISNITATQATAIEAIMNSERHYIQDTNTRVASIEAALAGEGENTIVAHLRMQTQYLRILSTIASAVYYPGKHGKGPGALKVITD